MSAAYILLGMAIGIVVGMQFYKYQILKKKNKKVIDQVKEWIIIAENK